MQLSSPRGFVNILFTCAGRRNYLINYFKAVIGNSGKTVATDSSRYVPALYEADIYYIVPSIDNDEYLDIIKEICRSNEVELLIPLNDLELPLLSQAKKSFEEAGTTVLVSDPEIIDICFDKLRTSRYIINLGFNAPKTYISLEDTFQALDNQELELPLIVKPRWGSA